MKERTQFNYAQRWKSEQNLTRQATAKRRKGILAFALVSLFVLALFASPWLWQLKLRYDLGIIETKIESYREVAEVLVKVESMQEEVAGMESFLDTAEGSSKNPRLILSKIRPLLPAGTTVTSFSLQTDNSVQIGLTLPGAVNVAQFWINFRDSGLFEDFDLSDVSLTDAAQNFNLTLKLKE